MKKILALVLFGALALSLVACGEAQTTNSGTPSANKINKSNIDTTKIVYQEDSYYIEENEKLHLMFSDGKEFIAYNDNTFEIVQNETLETDEYLKAIPVGKGVVEFQEDGSLNFVYEEDLKEAEKKTNTIQYQGENVYTFNSSRFKVQGTKLTTISNSSASNESQPEEKTLYKRIDRDDGTYLIREYYDYEHENIKCETVYTAEDIMSYVSEYDEDGNELYYAHCYGSGAIHRKVELDKNRTTTKETDYYENGVISSEILYDGEIQFHKQYYQSGELSEEVVYYPSGQVVITGYSENGLYSRHEERMPGQSTYKVIYKNNMGNVVGEIAYDEYGNDIYEKEYYDNGVTLAWHWEREGADGYATARWYDENGTLCNEETYYENGNLRSESIYANGKLIYSYKISSNGNSVSKEGDRPAITFADRYINRQYDIY